MPWRARPTHRHKTFGVRLPEPKCTKRCCKLWFLRFRSIYRINKLRELHQNWKIHEPKSLYCAPKLSASVQMPYKEKLKVKPPMPHPLIDHDRPCSNKDNNVNCFDPLFLLVSRSRPREAGAKCPCCETKGECCRDESLQSEALRLYDILKTNIKAFEPKCHSTITYNILNRTQSLSYSVASTQSGT